MKKLTRLATAKKYGHLVDQKTLSFMEKPYVAAQVIRQLKKAILCMRLAVEVVWTEEQGQLVGEIAEKMNKLLKTL